MKVYVGNLPYSVDSEKLKELFSSFGEIEEATVITDKYSGRSKGFGFVTFKAKTCPFDVLISMPGIAIICFCLASLSAPLMVS